MKQLRRDNSTEIKYTPMMPKTDATGKTTLVKIGRPVSAANEHELRKKMQNRASAIEARLKKKRKMDELEKKVQELTAENEKLRFDNAKLQCKVEWKRSDTAQPTPISNNSIPRSTMQEFNHPCSSNQSENEVYLTQMQTAAEQNRTIHEDADLQNIFNFIHAL